MENSRNLYCGTSTIFTKSLSLGKDVVNNYWDIVGWDIMLYRWDTAHEGYLGEVGKGIVGVGYCGDWYRVDVEYSDGGLL